MPPRIVFPILALTALLSVACCFMAVAEEPGSSANQQPNGLEFRVYSLPTSVFCTPGLDVKQGPTLKPKPGVVQLNASALQEYDVRGFLQRYGVTFPPDSLAFYSWVLVVRDTAPNLRILDKLFGGVGRLIRHPLGIQTSAYECTFPADGSQPPWDRLVYPALRDMPAGSVKLIDSVSEVVMSGQRATTSHTANADGNAGAPFKPGETGIDLELEPVQGPDGSIVDLNVSYHMQASLENGKGSQVADISFITSTDVWNGCPAATHVASVPGQPGKYIIVTLEASDGDRQVADLPEPKLPLRPVAKLKQAGPKLLMKVYRVPPGFLNVMVNGAAPQGPMDAAQFLKQAGVAFPPGSLAVYDKKTSTLIILNTEENIDLVDQIVDTLNSEQPEIVMAGLSAYECQFPADRIPAGMDKFTFKDLGALPRGSVKLLCCTSFNTKSGQRAEVSDVTPAPGKPAANLPQQGALKFQDGESGMMFVVEPVVGPDGSKIDTQTDYLLRLGDGIPEIAGQPKLTAQSGEPQIVQVVPVKDRKGAFIVIAIRMATVNPGGWTVPHVKTTHEEALRRAQQQAAHPDVAIPNP